MGESKPSCGQIRYEERCMGNCGEPGRKIKVNCEDPSCSVCGEDYVSELAWEIAGYLLDVKQAWKDRGVDLGELYHVANISDEPHGRDHKPIESNAEYQRYRRKLQNWLKRFGAHGSLFVHPVRGSSKQIEMYRDGILELPYAYHGHSFAFFPKDQLMSLTEFNKKSKMVIKVKKLSSQNIHNIYKVIRYELDHAVVGIEKGKHNTKIVTYYGVCSRNKFEIIELPQPEKVKLCLNCGSEIHKFDGDLDLGPVTIREVMRLCKLRKSAFDHDVPKYGFEVNPDLVLRNKQALLEAWI